MYDQGGCPQGKVYLYNYQGVIIYPPLLGLLSFGGDIYLTAALKACVYLSKCDMSLQYNASVCSHKLVHKVMVS